MNTLIYKNVNTYLKNSGESSTWIAIASFAIGTLFFATYKWHLNPESVDIVGIGFLYVVIAVFANTLVLLNLLWLFITQADYREYFAIKMLIVLANIPVVFLYLHML